MATASVDVPKNLGPLLIGGLFASVLSGAVAIQTIVYIKVYPTDSLRQKSLVLVVLIFDLFHTAMIWSSLWNYVIDHFGDRARLNFIPWSIALSIVVTAIVTFLVHCFLGHRIHKLSQGKWYLTLPILLLALLRLAAASVTAAELIELHDFSEFGRRAGWVFTLGLSLSTTVDVIITTCLFVLLQTSRTGAAGLNAIIDSLILYAFETGLLTSAGTAASMICWVASSNNLIFLGIHFVIGKFYATSLLVTLNSRKEINHQRSQASADTPLSPIHLFNSRRRQTLNASYLSSNDIPRSATKSKEHGSDDSLKVEISVAKNIHYQV